MRLKTYYGQDPELETDDEDGEAATASDQPRVHIYFLLDRSGSMESIASDVVGGFNAFLAEQQADGEDAVMTFVQFDTQDAHEVLAAALPISRVPRLTASTFLPRGGTPLYDAIGHLVADATIRSERLAAAGEGPEAILFVTFTDGLENQSREYTRERVFELVKKREAQGWSFVYLGANQDAYAESGAIGYSAGNTQNFAATPAGSRAAFAGLSASVSRRRGQVRQGEQYDAADLFEDGDDT